MALIFDSRTCAHGFPVCVAAIGIAQSDVLRGRLKRVADRVVVRHHDRRWLLTINQKSRQAGRDSQSILGFGPATRSDRTLLLQNLVSRSGGILCHQGFSGHHPGTSVELTSTPATGLKLKYLWNNQLALACEFTTTNYTQRVYLSCKDLMANEFHYVVARPEKYLSL